MGGEGVLRTHGRMREAVAVIHRALDQGVTYCDTAPAYAGSLDYYGAALGERRSQVFLASKTHDRTRDGLYIVIGVVLIRHLDLTVAVIGLIVGLTWIVSGLSALFGGVVGSREGRGWWIFFGIVSLIAGIVVVADPISSVTVLAVLIGIWFVVMGLIEVSAAFIIRRAVSASPPAQRFAGDEAATL